MPVAARTAPGRRPAGPSRFAPHVDEGVSPFAALVPTPARTSALGATLDAELTAFAARTGNGAWPHLPRAVVAARLAELVRDPTRLDQAGLNACGPAAALYLFAKRRPESFARFAMTLYDSGAADFGSVRVTGAGLQHKDPTRMPWPSGLAPQPLDWMVLSATLRSEGDLTRFAGEPTDALSGITLPGELARWLRDGAGYAEVTDEANSFVTKDLDHLRRLAPGPDLDVVTLVNVDAVEQRSGSAGTLRTAAGAIGSLVSDAVQRQFPNHWFVLEQPVSDDGERIRATAWTWGRSGHVFAGPHAGWQAGYYGAIQARV